MHSKNNKFKVPILLKIMKPINYYISHTNYYLLLLISFFIPFYQKIVPPLIILWFVTSLLKFSFENFKKSTHKALFYAITGYFIFATISLLWTINIGEGIKDLESKLSLIVFPLTFTFGVLLDKNKQINVIKAFILGNFITIIIQLAIATFRFFMIEDVLTFDTPTNGISVFYYVPFSYFTHPSYASMFSLFSIISIFYLVFKQNESKNWFYFVLIFLPSIYLYSSKAGMIAFFAVTTILSIYTVIKYNKMLLNAILLITIMLLSFIIYKNERVQTLIYSKKINIAESNNTQKTDARIIIWQKNIELLKENLILGTGAGDYKDEIVKKYKKINYKKGIEKKLDSHNQFLKSFIVFGIFGFVNILFIFILMFYYSIKERNLYTLLFAIVLFLNFLVESMFVKQSGIVFIGFFLSFLFLTKRKQELNT